MSEEAPGSASWAAGVAPVGRPLPAARASYDRLSGVYDLIEEPFERRATAAAMDLLAVHAGERVLEIGPGTGRGLVALARRTGPSGLVTGVDLSAGMLRRSRRRTRRSGMGGRILLAEGDAHRLPLRGGTFDAVFASFVLELIDTGEIATVLGECRRVLRPGGRLGLVSLQLTLPPPPVTRLYLAARRRLPSLLDCRPIPLAALLAASGWQVRALRPLSLGGLPATAVTATVVQDAPGRP